MAAFGIIGLVIFTYVRPHELFEQLRDYNFLYVFLAISAIGIARDVHARRTQLLMTPHTKYVLLFALWALLTLAIRKPSELTSKGTLLAVCLVLYLVIAHGIQQVSVFYRVVSVVFAAGLFVAYVGADQGMSPYQCVVTDPGNTSSRAYTDGRECRLVEPDGTPHDGNHDCAADGNPALTYQCERAGLFGTTSVGGGRVRYLGVLLDPNELALATALAVPFAFVFFEIRRTILRLALLVATLVVVASEIVFTGSRGGQLTLGGVLGTYFVKKYGWKRGALVGLVMAVPVIALGGRSDESADESTLERLGCSAAGLKMLMQYPLTGVGYSQYLDHHFMTAHNAYVLAAGELGLPGMWLFGILLYLSIKVPITVLELEMVDDEQARTLKALAMGMLAAFVGGSVGIFFLSWTYHYVLWIHFGMCSALYACTKRLFPTYECRLTGKEARNTIAGYVAVMFVWSLYIKHKGAW